MRHLKDFTFYFILLCLIACYNQDGFEVIQKAERSLANGRLDEASDLLEQAYSLNYGDCGNAYVEAFLRITELKVSIHLKKGEYRLARTVLDSSHFYGRTIDSLRIMSYQLEQGSDSLSRMIDSSLNKVTFQLQRESYYVNAIIPLMNGVDTMTLEAIKNGNKIYETQLDEINLDEWRREFQSSWRYKMLKEQ